MPKPDANWLDTLPRSRCLAEFSLWSSNLIALDADVARVGDLVDIYHIDVADGVFAPSLLFFPDIVAALRKRTAVPFHVHLMCADAVLLSQVDQFAEAGADLISVHVENGNAVEALARIKGHGLMAGVVLRVETPVEAAGPFMEAVDMLTLLGTRIGVKGQSLAPTATTRLGQARALIAARRTPSRCILAADGGIRAETVPLLVAAGAETVVLGSLAYAAEDLSARIAWLRGLR
ncbi:MAG: ribulose-phosphate 3-epimerase [Pseudorhodobacter sp.]|nr:ribulose-phosphate 3-epimerase [Pseudorhodobacter sp.]